MPGRIRVGIGGWVFPPWRASFYPPGLAQKRELEFASRQVAAIEINSTFYGPQKPETFARWRDETPENFVFTVKALRAIVQKRVLAETGEATESFFAGGVMELGDKLGPINWQLPPYRKFDPADLEAFLALLPKDVGGRTVAHVLEAHHPSFRTAEVVELLRSHGVGLVLSDKSAPPVADATAPIVYLRLQRAAEEEAAGYPSEELDQWADRARVWSSGGTPDDLERLGGPEADAPNARDVFVFMINGFKPKAPAAAQALIARLAKSGAT